MTRTSIEAFRVIGVSATVRNSDSDAIAQLWERFETAGVAGQLPAKLGDDVHCVYDRYAGDQSDPFRMTVGFKAADDTDVPTGLSDVRVPAQSIMSWDASGEQPAALVATWQSIWNSGIARSFVADFDVYDAARPDRVTVYVGVET